MSKKIAILLLAFMLTACSNASTSDSQAETEAVSETTTTTVTTTDDSEKTTTTTTQITVTSAKEKDTDVTTKSVTSASTTTKAESTTAASTMARASVAATKVTTKATVKQTTQGFMKTAAKPTTTTAKPQTTTDLSKLTPYWRALYNMTFGNTTKQDCEVVRNELLAYGKKLYPQFAINTKLHPLITKDGKYTDSFTEAEGGTNSDTEYYTVVPWGMVGINYPYVSDEARMEAARTFDTNFKTVIKNTLQDSTRFDASQTVWYISYGFENKGGGVGTYSWVCMTAFPDDWK